MRALVLLSGGLDSLLATRLIQNQGIKVKGICFSSPFFSSEKGERASKQLSISCKVVDIGKELISLLPSPPHGFGKGANPCIDCHILMVKKAGSLMQSEKFSFLITGEVLGERPKSQNRWALDVVARESGWGDYLLRPLTAKNLPPTLPEQRGWVDREKLFGIKGKSRYTQLKLAEEFNFKQFPTPAGGCLLTDPNFSRRVKYILSYHKLTLREAELLKVGRHFCLNHTSRLIVGRNKKENEQLITLASQGDVFFQVVDFPGPVALLKGSTEEEFILRAASLTARYSDAPPGAVKVQYYQIPQKEKRWVQVNSMEEEMVEKLRIEKKL